jgi:hypothetical protein
MAKSIPRSIPVPPLTDGMYRAAKRTAKKNDPTDVTAAHFNASADTLDLTLRSGITVRFPRTHVREIAGAPPRAVRNIAIQPGGDGISFLDLDVHISVPGLLADELGALFARAIGRRARGKTSPKKAASSRRNGAQGGRPRKKAA